MKPIEYINGGLLHGRLGDNHCMIYTNSMLISPIHGIIVAWYIIKETIKDNIQQ